MTKGLLLSDAPTAEEIERDRVSAQLARGSLWRRVAISTIRLELGDLAGQWAVLSVPNMHAITTCEFKSNAQFVLAELTALNAIRRLDLTRRGGTCPSCSHALMPPTNPALRRKDNMGWCPQCCKYVVPAGARS